MMNETSLRAIVVEDERLPRLALLKKLEGFRPEVEVIDSCASYEVALQSILRNKPDLLFLDIQLSGHDSMELLERLQAAMELPYIIFTTAYTDRRYLLRAIKLAAVDYLLKPIDVSELAMAIARARQTHELRAAAPAEELPRLTLRTVNGKVFITHDDIGYIRADGNYSILTTFHGEESLQDNLSTLEHILDPTVFLRVDRSTIVNTRLIYKLNSRRRLCILRAQDGTTLELELTKTGFDMLMGMA